MIAEMHARPRHAKGMVLIIVLILLGIMTLIVAALVRTGNVNFRIAGNEQYQQEARLAAQNALETYITNPANFAAPLPTTTTSTGIDLDGDGNNEYTADTRPAIFVGEVAAQKSEITNSDNLSICFQKDLGIDDPQAPPSQGDCKFQTWDVQANVADPVTNTSVEAHQGVKVLAKNSTPSPVAPTSP